MNNLLALFDVLILIFDAFALGLLPGLLEKLSGVTMLAQKVFLEARPSKFASD